MSARSFPSVWSNPYRRRWVLWGILAASFLLVSVYRLSTAVISGQLMDAFGTTGAQLGTLHAAFFVVYAVMQIPTGVLVDRFGPRRTATAGAAMMNVGAIWFGLAAEYGGAFFLTGALYGTFVLTYPMIQARYDDRASGIALGTINGASFFGAATFPPLMGWALDAYWTGELIDGVRVYTVTGYRVAFAIGAAAGLVAVGCALWLHRRGGTG